MNLVTYALTDLIALNLARDIWEEEGDPDELGWAAMGEASGPPENPRGVDGVHTLVLSLADRYSELVERLAEATGQTVPEMYRRLLAERAWDRSADAALRDLDDLIDEEFEGRLAAAAAEKAEFGEDEARRRAAARHEAEREAFIAQWLAENATAA
ncbi:hypothetical protein [Streptomyces sp. NPDC096033]|uniref:hypothetical protein n=1 Tax=Streptomyces sp. NPDC096033 TaxID=3366071 RepID=UPI003809043F